jgi:single-strand DNA-binding protein
VPRKYKREGEADCDFINCVAFGKSGEFADMYLHKGMKIAIVGRIQTGSYTNKDGVKVYTTDVVVEEHEFCESKSAANGESGNSGGYSGNNYGNQPTSDANDGFMHIPDGIDEELPFN